MNKRKDEKMKDITITIEQEREDWEQISAILASAQIYWEQLQHALRDPDRAEHIQEQLDNMAYGLNIARERLERLPQV
jgi:hypothetical protein